MEVLRIIVIDSFSLPVSSSGSSNNVRPMPTNRRHHGRLSGLGHLRPALPVLDGTSLHRHGVLVVGRCGGAGRAGRPAHRHSERRRRRTASQKAADGQY